MSFDKDQYWAQRNAEKSFRKEWSVWRSDSMKLWGPTFVNANPSMFTQAAFLVYLQTLDEAGDKYQEAQLQLEAPGVEITPLTNMTPEVADPTGLNVSGLDGDIVLE